MEGTCFDPSVATVEVSAANLDLATLSQMYADKMRTFRRAKHEIKELLEFTDDMAYLHDLAAGDLRSIHGRARKELREEIRTRHDHAGVQDDDR